MRIQACKLQNFASYKELDFNFDSQGLILIHGATGSGKSTLCDAVPWALFGRTAKGGLADEVLSWNSDEPTIVTVYLDAVTIYRTRGVKPKDNDLMFWPCEGQPTRGKDINDTQKLINNLLGLDAELYLSGAYYHEFSQTAQFFTTTAKNRRSICEQLVDLTLPKKLQENITANYKELKTTYADEASKIERLDYEIELLKKCLISSKAKSTQWALNYSNKYSFLSKQAALFEVNKDNKISSLKLKLTGIEAFSDEFYGRQIDKIISDMPPESEPCKECGVYKINSKRENALLLLRKLKEEKTENEYKLTEISSLRQQVKETVASKNAYQDQLEALKSDENEHVSDVNMFEIELANKNSNIIEAKQKASNLLTQKTDLELLTDAVVEFRGLLIKNTILDVQDKTNVLLSNHFDAEIKIELSIEDSDKLEISILKDYNRASYTQLSKGQRQLLKLCFGVAVMKAVANHHGVRFSQIFLDECLDGLDEGMKLKAVSLLETLTLEYDSIFFVDHSETIKAMINNKFKVELINGNSVINEETK